MKNWEIIASLLEREEHALGSVVEYMIHGYQSRNIPAQNIREESNSECPADNELLMPCKNTQTFWETIEREFEHHFQDIDAHFNKLFKLRTRRPGAKKLQPLDPWWYLEDLEDSFEDVKEYLLIRNRTKCECLFKKLKNEIKKGMEPTPPTCPSVLGSIPLERKFRYVHQNFYVRDNSRFAMGHTRMTTQGSARKNYNNHPFRGIMQTGTFALAHNGVLDNDISLRKSLHLSRTRIETDSYIAVQLIVQKGILNFDSLRYMAELLEGSFTITVLGDDGSFYIVKGDNPFCLYFFPDCGLYLYASTEEILRQALRKLQVPLGKSRKVPVQCGEILRINQTGRLDRETFDDSKLFRFRYPRFLMNDPYCRSFPHAEKDTTHLDELKTVALAFGYSPEDIDLLAAQGFTAEELEDLFYSGEI